MEGKATAKVGTKGVEKVEAKEPIKATCRDLLPRFGTPHVADAVACILAVNALHTSTRQSAKSVTNRDTKKIIAEALQ